MPYHLSEDGLTVLLDDGTIVKRHPSKAKALAHLRALQVNVPEAVDRNTAIRDARTPAELRTQAERFGISLSHAYRLRKGAVQTLHAASQPAPERFQVNMTRGLLFNEMSTYGLKRSGGLIDEDYDRTFKPLSKKVKVYREMGDDPIVAAVLQAIKMLIRRVSWYVQPGGSTDADKAAAEFIETCMQDMSQSWMDSIDEALAMLQYGFSVAEIVYKRRQGERKEAGSTYDDGRIGWRKWLYLAPYSLAPGEPWTFDEHGGIQSINQLDYYTELHAEQVNIPIDKALLFRTTAESNNPEGRAILRPMYWPYYLKRNLEEIEAISAERLGTGLPVVYAGQDVAKGSGADTDFEKLKDIVRNIRVDEQMGVAIPFAKMGGGAREGEGVLLELLTPTQGRMIDFNAVITRYAQQMAMTGLAQFIHLGMNNVGARALGESSQDFFTLSVSGWADLIEETIHRYATERLMKLNHFPGMTVYPRITHESIVRKSLPEVADYINKLVGAMVITPDGNLEKYLRELAELPEKDEATAIEAPPEKEPEGNEPEGSEPDTEPVEHEPEPEGETELKPEQETGETEGKPAELASESFEALARSLSEATLALQEPPADAYGELIAALREATRELAREQTAPQFNVTIPPATQNYAINMPDQAAPIVNVPEAQAPTVMVNVPAPIVNVTNEAQTFEMPPAQVTVNVPEQQAPIINVPAPIVNVTNEAQTFEMPAAQVTVNVPEQPPAQVTVEVQPTPIEITNEVNLPEQEAPKRKVSVRRDKEGNLTGATIENVDEDQP